MNTCTGIGQCSITVEARVGLALVVGARGRGWLTASVMKGKRGAGRQRRRQRRRRTPLHSCFLHSVRPQRVSRPGAKRARTEAAWKAHAEEKRVERSQAIHRALGRSSPGSEKQYRRTNAAAGGNQGLHRLGRRVSGFPIYRLCGIEKRPLLSSSPPPPSIHAPLSSSRIGKLWRWRC